MIRGKDVKKAAMVIAGTVYHLAMRDELLPRFSKEEMPRSPGGPPATPPSTSGAPATTAPSN